VKTSHPDTFVLYYVIRCIGIDDPNIKALQVKHAAGLTNCANVAVDKDNVICVA